MTDQATATVEPNLRLTDLIAKVAGVTLRDTLRVLSALDAVSLHYELPMDTLVEGADYEPSRPDMHNVAACASADFRLRNDAEVKFLLDRIRGLQ